MKPHPTDPQPTASGAERLLGGYATGTLSEAEKKELFQAALQDQELFNALADEEALRELLSHPSNRAHLIEVLSRSLKPEAHPKRALPLWRSPLWMGVAASLVLAVGTHLIWTRSPQIHDRPSLEVPQPQNEAPQNLKTASAAPKNRDSPKIVAQSKESTRTQEPSSQASTHPKMPPSPAPPARESEKSEPQPLTARSEAQVTFAPQILADTAPKNENKGLAASIPAPATLDARSQKRHPLRTDRLEEALPELEPHVHLSPRMDGQIPVRIAWPSTGHLYVTTRHQGHIRLLTAQSTEKQGPLTHSYFAWRAEAGDELDVYLLSAPLSANTSLDQLQSLSFWHTRHIAAP